MDYRKSTTYERWQDAVDSAFDAGIAAFLVVATGTCACQLRTLGLLSDGEFADYLALPTELRSTWEDPDLLELARAATG